MKTAIEHASCTSCARALSRACWQELPLVGTIDHAAILCHVSVWPQGRRIEVRACRACGRSIARTARDPLEV